MLSTSPRQQVPFKLKRLRPFSLLVDFKKADKSPVDLTGAEVRLVIAQQVRQGGAILVTSEATLTNAVAGLVQFDIQGDDLDMVAGQYVLSATLVSAEGFESTIFEGDLEIEHNADTTIPPDYSGVIPPLGLTVTMRSANKVTIRLNHIPDSVLLAFVLEAQAAASQAGIYAQQAAAAAVEAEDHSGDVTGLVAAAAASAAAADADATAAAASAQNALTWSLNANTSKNTAVSAADGASTNATAAAASATAAAGSADEAAASAAAAAASEAAAEAAAAETENFVHSTTIDNLVVLTQAAYDAIPVPASTTLYMIVG